MYFQITTRCNMTCAHCCYSCTAKGENMSLKVFKMAMKNIGYDHISIGGGEPTLHPKFLEILIYAIAEMEYVWIATNGSKKKHALLLAKLAKQGVISAVLSQDGYHDPIPRKVIDAFIINKNNLQNTWRMVKEDAEDGRGIRTVTQISKSGRAEENGIYDNCDCPCDTVMVKPNGDINWCGCVGAKKIGDYKTGITDKEYEQNSDHECYKGYLKHKEEEDEMLSDCVEQYKELG